MVKKEVVKRGVVDQTCWGWRLCVEEDSCGDGGCGGGGGAEEGSGGGGCEEGWTLLNSNCHGWNL